MRLLLAALFFVPSPLLAQTVRLAVETPVLSAPAFTPALSPVASGPTLSLSAPALSPLAGSFSVLPAPAIQAAPVVAAAVPAALHPVASAVASVPATPERPDAPVEAAKARADERFDGSVVPAESEAVAVPAGPAASPAVLARTNALGRAPAPRPWLEKAKVVLAYGGLTASAVAIHAPFDRIGPLVVAVVMSPMLTMMWGLFYSYAQQGAKAAPATEILGDHPPGPGTLERLTRLAAEAKLPPPARLRVRADDEVQAFAGTGENGYQIEISRGLESLPGDEQDAILRHELAHIRHHDSKWTFATMLMTPLPVMIGLMGLIDKPEIFNWLVGAIATTSILLFPASLKHSEYLADQYAASGPEGAGPLARFFLRDAKNPERAASALSGKPFASETGWRRAAVAGWDRLRTLFSAHPSHDRRVARLARIAGKTDAP